VAALFGGSHTAEQICPLVRLSGLPNEKGVVMKVFVAGATGALGKQLVPMLVANGHDVVGMTRTEAKRSQLRSVGAQPVVVDALDADAVRRAVSEAEPDVIVHELTAIPPAINMRSRNCRCGAEHRASATNRPRENRRTEDVRS
jgi:2-alkyl-3-oxoalkanoate reductase